MRPDRAAGEGGPEDARVHRARIDDFLISHGGPFYDLQRRLGLLHDSALRAGSRALLFVCIAWLVPLVLSLAEGHAFGRFEDRPFLLDLGVWARFLIAVGLLVLMERQVERGLSAKLAQFARAPLIAPGSMRAAAEAVNRALRRRDSRIAELACLLLAALATFASLLNAQGSDARSWLAEGAGEGATLTLAAWWCLLVSSPIFWFLLFRALWRHLVWSMLLRDLAGLDLRLVATHPDARGGLAFVGQYPNAYATFVLAMSCVVGALLANDLLHDKLSIAVYGSVMGAWLAIVLGFFAFPLMAFTRPLSELKQQTLMLAGAQATRFQRQSERKVLGTNVGAPDPSESETVTEIADPTPLFEKTRKLSIFLLSRSALVPVCAAALLPLMAAGVTRMPYKEMLAVAKRLLLL